MPQYGVPNQSPTKLSGPLIVLSIFVFVFSGKKPHG
jgi:hypothetical protein